MGALPPEGEIGYAVSGVLSDARTVLSRAETALRDIKRRPHWYIERTKRHWDRESETMIVDSPAVVTEHPGVDQITEALEAVVEALSPFAKTGKTRYNGDGY